MFKSSRLRISSFKIRVAASVADRLVSPRSAVALVVAAEDHLERYQDATSVVVADRLPKLEILEAVPLAFAFRLVDQSVAACRIRLPAASVDDNWASEAAELHTAALDIVQTNSVDRLDSQLVVEAVARTAAVADTSIDP